MSRRGNRCVHQSNDANPSAKRPAIGAQQRALPYDMRRDRLRQGSCANTSDRYRCGIFAVSRVSSSRELFPLIAHSGVSQSILPHFVVESFHMLEANNRPAISGHDCNSDSGGNRGDRVVRSAGAHQIPRGMRQPFRPTSAKICGQIFQRIVETEVSLFPIQRRRDDALPCFSVWHQCITLM